MRGAPRTSALMAADEDWWDVAFAQQESDQGFAPWEQAGSGDPMGLGVVALGEQQHAIVTSAGCSPQSIVPVTPQSVRVASVLPEQTPQAKRRRLLVNQPPLLLASSATSSSSELPFSGSSELPIQFKRPAARCPLDTARQELADMCEASPELPQVVDWRSNDQKEADYHVVVKLGRRLHYKDTAMDHCGKAGKEHKTLIRAAWCNLSPQAQRAVYERLEQEMDLDVRQKLHVNRLLVFARCATSDEFDGSGVRGATWLRAKQALLTYHDDTWVLGRPSWNFDDAAEPLAAAAKACRDDPFVQNLSCELERDILSLQEVLMLESWSASLELCPETFALGKGFRLHAHLAIVFAERTRIAHKETCRVAGVNPSHAKAAGPLQAVRSRNFAPLHYYLQMPKQGGVWSQTTLPAFKSFPINPRWITTWLQSDHLSLRVARREYVKCKMNLLSTLPNLDVVERELQREAIAAKQHIIEEALRVELCEFVAVPEKRCSSRSSSSFGAVTNVSCWWGVLALAKQCGPSGSSATRTLSWRSTAPAAPSQTCVNSGPCSTKASSSTRRRATWFCSNKNSSRRRPRPCDWVAPRQTATPTTSSSAASAS